MDLRDYRGVIRDAVADLRKKDENWGWHVKSVGKHVAHIGWGYLDYIGETDDMHLGIHDEGVSYKLPCGEFGAVLVGDERWDDTPHYETAIRMAVDAIGRRAHSLY